MAFLYLNQSNKVVKERNRFFNKPVAVTFGIVAVGVGSEWENSLK